MIATGVVSNYDADTKTYVVNLDIEGDTLCRRMLTGVDKPYPPGARVVLMRGGYLDWMIVGEVDMPEQDPGANRRQTVDEAAADLDAILRDVRLQESIGEFPRYRPSDEYLQFAGDVSIENRAERQSNRSRVKVFSFGAVLAFASNLCFTLWDKRNNKMLVQFRDLIERGIGYVRTITTRPDDPRTVVREQIQGDPLATESDAENPPPPKIDRETIIGHIPNGDQDRTDLAEGPKAERGERRQYTRHRYEEVDNNTHTHRIRQDVIENEDQDDESITTERQSYEGNLEELERDNKRGTYTIYRDWLEIEVDNDNHVLRIKNLNGPDANEIVLTDESTSVVRGEQSWVLDDDGLTINVKEYRLNAEQDITEEAGGNHTSIGREIHHNN